MTVAAPVRYSASTWQQPVPPPASGARAALLDTLAAVAVRRAAGRLLIGIDGFTAAGKTSFGHELAVRIAEEGRQVLRASLDDFKRPWSESHLYDRESGEGYFRNAFDYPRLRDLLLEPCRDVGAAHAALCAIDPLTQRDHSAQRTPLTPDSVLIADGVFAFRPEIDDLWDLRVWLSVDEELSVRRGTARDGDGWAGAQAETIHRDRYLVSERIYIAECDPVPRADFVVDNGDFAVPRLIGA